MWGSTRSRGGSRWGQGKDSVCLSAKEMEYKWCPNQQILIKRLRNVHLSQRVQSSSRGEEVDALGCTCDVHPSLIRGHVHISLLGAAIYFLTWDCAEKSCLKQHVQFLHPLCFLKPGVHEGASGIMLTFADLLLQKGIQAVQGMHRSPSAPPSLPSLRAVFIILNLAICFCDEPRFSATSELKCNVSSLLLFASKSATEARGWSWFADIRICWKMRNKTFLA